MTRSSVALSAALLLAACGSADSATDAADRAVDDATTTIAETTVPETTVPETTTTTEAAVEEAMEDDAAMEDDTAMADADDDAAMEDDGAAMDDADDVTDLDADLDGSEAEAMLGFMMAAFGVEDPEAVGQCVLDRLESEGFELDMEGDGGPEMVALIGCEPTALKGLYEAGLVDGASNLDDAQIDCTIDSLGLFISEIPLAEADTILDSDLPPEEFMSSVTSECDISREALEAFLNG